MRLTALNLSPWSSVCAAALCFFAPSLFGGNPEPSPSQRLVLVGGGELPATAMDKFVDWAKPGKEKTLKVAFVVWSTGTPEAYFTAFRDEDMVPALKRKNYPESGYVVFPSPTREALLSPDAKARAAAKMEFMKNLENTTAVFFSGGDQREAVRVLKEHPDIAAALKQMYRRGIVFGGTSAGTALMSSPMIQADDKHPKKFDVEDGFGLLPQNVLIDQHFLKRKREARMKASLLKTGKSLGLGVDEDGAILVENNQVVTAVGPRVLTIYLNSDSTSLEGIETVSLIEGQKFHLDDMSLGRAEVAADLPGDAKAGLGSVIRKPETKKSH